MGRLAHDLDALAEAVSAVREADSNLGDCIVMIRDVRDRLFAAAADAERADDIRMLTVVTERLAEVQFAHTDLLARLRRAESGFRLH